MPLDGVWYNELNSSMDIKVNGSQITGTYTNAAGQLTGNFTLTGAVDPTPGSAGQAVSFVVSWPNGSQKGHSVTARTGTYRKASDGTETLHTEWLLTTEVTQGKEWLSTLAGHDEFTRKQPPKAKVEMRMALRAWPVSNVV